jgi:hypothetical protein
MGLLRLCLLSSLAVFLFSQVLYLINDLSSTHIQTLSLLTFLLPFTFSLSYLTVAFFTSSPPHCQTHFCYDHTQLELMKWVKRKNCVVSDIRWRFECQLDHENVESTLAGWVDSLRVNLVLYRKDCFSYGNNCVQLNTSYQLLVYSTPRTEIFISTSTNLFNIWGISDQDVTLWTLLQYKNDNQCTEVSFDKSSQPSRPSANNQCTQGISTQCSQTREKLWAFLIKLELYIEFNQAKFRFKMNKGLFTVSYQRCSIQLS